MRRWWLLLARTSAAPSCRDDNDLWWSERERTTESNRTRTESERKSWLVVSRLTRSRCVSSYNFFKATYLLTLPPPLRLAVLHRFFELLFFLLFFWVLLYLFRIWVQSKSQRWLTQLLISPPLKSSHPFFYDGSFLDARFAIKINLLFKLRLYWINYLAISLFLKHTHDYKSVMKMYLQNTYIVMKLMHYYPYL